MSRPILAAARRRWIVGGVVTAMVVCGAAVIALTAGGAAANSATAGSGRATDRPQPLAGQASAVQDPVAATPDPIPAGAVATRIDIPAIGVSANLEHLAVDGSGQLQPPVDFRDAGWYADGVLPGRIGPAIIAGHIDRLDGPAVFQHLDRLHSGDTATVTLSTGAQETFTVTGSVQSAKATFPTSQVYGDVPTPQLRIITCDGAFDTTVHHYTDNLIVFATLTE